MTLVVAHRGASRSAPENTMEAFRLAVEMGADAIELDVHLTADGELALMHDETMDRTTDRAARSPTVTLKKPAQPMRAAIPGRRRLVPVPRQGDHRSDPRGGARLAA